MRKEFLCCQLLALSAAVVSAQPVPLDLQFQLNTYTTGRQSLPAAAVDSLGNFMVVWDSGQYGTGPDGSSSSIQGQRFSASGNPLGDEFVVNSYTTGVQLRPSIAVDSNDQFLVVWHSFGSPGSDTSLGSILGRRFSSDGFPIGLDFQLNSYTLNTQYRPNVASGANSDFVVVWHSNGSGGSDSSGYSIRGQRFASDGNTLGAEFQVNSYTTGNQYFPFVSVDDAGRFVVVWSSAGSSGTDIDRRSVQGQRYSSDGSPRGAEFQVNTYTTNYQNAGAVATGPAGNFVVVWDSYGSNGTDSSSYSIQGQQFSAEGAAIGGEFQINTFTLSNQQYPSVAFDIGGGFLVVWQDISQNTIEAQFYSSEAVPEGGEFQVNSFSDTEPYDRYRPLASVGTRGHLVVVWHSSGSAGADSDDASIQGRQYEFLLFADGFETGDTSAWLAIFP